MAQRAQVPAMVFSLALHAVLLVGLWMVKYAVEQVNPQLMIETVIADEDRQQEEFVQELDEKQEIAETLNFVAGGPVSDAIGGSNSLKVSQQVNVEYEDVVRDPDVKVNVSTMDIPAMTTLGNDLGEMEVTGEVGAVVEGYGAALDRMTQELIRMMRSNRLHVVWLFDESESMKDDQQDLKARIHRVYEELKLADTDPEIGRQSRGKSKKDNDVLLTTITSFGEKFTVHTPKPTNDPPALMAAIDRIPIDRTGAENTCMAMLTAIRQFGSSRDRKLVLIVVSDESGDDGMGVEEVLQAAKSQRTPIYIMGREAVFGSLYAHVRWNDPSTGHLHYLPIRRGPETPYAEQLQWDGYRRRRDAQMSGFGPYEQVRLARDTGGIFFQLPNEETNINGLDNRKFEALDLREYLPSLDSRRVYQEERDRSPFRKAVWDVIVMLNPYDERNTALELPEHENFHVNPAESLDDVMKRLKQVTALWTAVAAAQDRLESVRQYRDGEESLRWRANYDLLVATLFAYRLRLYEYGIALHQFQKTIPQRIKDPKHNRWAIRMGAKQLILPDAQQEQFLKITAAEVKEAHKKALENFQKVKEQHPRTAWARRAEWEESRGFGATFGSWQYVPPKQPQKPRPKPTPPPKL